MPNNIAKIFMRGRSQSVRLPKDSRLPGKELRITQVGDKLILEPVAFDVKSWFAKLDTYRDVPFMPEGRDQTPMPEDKFDWDEAFRRDDEES